MNKRLMALAVASALGIPTVALAQGTSVTIYGTLNADFERVEAKDSNQSGPGNSLVGAPSATSPELDPRNRVSSNSSNIGFRGTEDLGNGLKAIFQCESSARVDNGGDGFCTRNTHVGLSGRWGTVFYGQWDTPFKVIGTRIDAFYATGIGDGEAFYGTPGLGVANATLSGTPGGFGGINSAGAANAGTSNNASFERRQGDSVQYWSPSWAGFSLRIGYSADEGKSSDPPGAAPGVANVPGVLATATEELDPYTWSVSATYNPGPLLLAIAYERHEDWFGLNGFTANAGAPSASNDSSTDQGIRATVGYRFGNTTLNVLWERLEYENDGGTGPTAATQLEQYERDIWYVSLLHKFGAWTLRAFYANADEGECDLVGGGDCNADETGADGWAIGASYSLSKRTDLYGYFVRIDNDDLQSYTFGVNGLRPGTAVGFENNGVALGIRHAF
jgi:predicted porin